MKHDKSDIRPRPQDGFDSDDKNIITEIFFIRRVNDDDKHGFYGQETLTNAADESNYSNKEPS